MTSCDAVDLRPCKCGGKVNLVSVKAVGGSGTLWKVVCSECGRCDVIADTPEFAAWIWNRGGKNV
jgi:ferredoxin-like protein FixX